MAFLSIFERLRRRKGEKEGDEGREKQGQERKRGAEGRKRAFRQSFATAIMATVLIIQLVSAPAAAAFSFGSVLHSASNFVDDVKHTVEGAGIGAVVGGALFGAACAVIPGVDLGTAACVEAGMAAGGIIGGWIGHHFGHHSDGGKKNNVLTSDQNATTADVGNDQDLADEYGLVDDATAKASSELAELLAKLATKPVEYTIDQHGATGNIQLKLFGPDQILGFSAFPVKLRIVTAADPIKQNVIHLNKVTMYVIRQDTGTAYYTYQKTFGPNETSLNGGAYTITTFLKVPDDLDVEVANALQTGQITEQLIEKIKQAKTPQFEIYVRVDATKEDWSYVNGTWKHVRDIPLTVEAETRSVYLHVTGGTDVILFQTGLNASMPNQLSNLYFDKFAPFIADQYGAVSDLLVRPYATPVHVANSTATWQFYVAPNVGFFKMFDSNPDIYDDFVVFAVRNLQGGQYELADRRANILGNLTASPVLKAYGATKYTFGPNIVDYKVYGIGLAWIRRDDGTKIPIWVMVQPHMTVLDPEKLALDDARLNRILPIFDDKKITSQELTVLKSEIESMRKDIQEKIQAAEQLKKMAEANGNQQAALYADRAIKYYQDELDMLGQVESTKDAQLSLNYLNAAKKYEYAADFEKQAAEKANDGDLEGAKYLDGQAKDFKKKGDEYLPHFNPGGFVNSVLSNLTDWKYLLLLAVLVIGGYYIFGRMGALAGLAIWLAIVIGIPALKGLVIWLKAKI